jgi:hypothetical protein
MRRKVISMLSSIATVLTIGLSSASAANAEPSTAATGEPTVNFTFPVWTSTTVVSWVHQCAAMHCGYHQIPAGQAVKNWCWSYNEGIYWYLITTASPWDPSILIAGFVSEDAVSEITAQQCNTVGEGPHWLTVPETWAHSCPSLNCGYGIMRPGEDIAQVCLTALSADGLHWDLVLDHDAGLHHDLAGFIPYGDLPGHSWNAPAC